MSGARHPISPFMPLLLSLALVAGLFIGRGLGLDGDGLGLLDLQRNDPANKLARVLDLIEQQYVDSVDEAALVDEALQDILQRLDPHSYYISAAELRATQEPLEGSFEGIGVEFNIQRDTVVVVAAVEGGPSEALGIRPGDRILAADGTPLAGVGITNDGVMRTLRGPKGSKVTVSILRGRNAKPFDVTIERGRVPINSVAVALLSTDGTGYIKLSRFARNTHEEFLKAAAELEGRGMQRLVLDLRGNGGGYLNSAVDLADEFLPAGSTIVYTQGRNSPRRDITATSRGRYEKVPLAVLIDEGSASASEIVAGALQDNDRCTLVGRRSFGKGLVQEHIDLPDRSAVRITTARYYTPTGRSIQRPYGSGIDYDGEFEERIEHGELLSPDSIPLDPLQVFTTRGGRKVYGGGGIMPDVFVPADTAEGSRYLTELFFSGALNQFAFDVADRERERLMRFGDHRSFDQRYRITDALLNELGRFAEQQGIRGSTAELERSRQRIAFRLKAGIARNIWGNTGFYHILLQRDSTYLRAVSALGAGG